MLKDRQSKERDRLAQVWQSLGPEQQEMRRQSELLNTLTKELETYRAESAQLEEACKHAGYYTDGGPKGARAMFANAMQREGVLVQTCKVENMIKESLDATERLLEREKKRLTKELERVRMEKFWNLADGFRKRNTALSPVEAIWLDEVHKIDEDVLKVRELRNLCWQRMHVDAQKLDNLRAWEAQRQERQEREEQRQRDRQERQERQTRERERERQQQKQQQYQQQYRPQPQPKPQSQTPPQPQERSSRPSHGYHTDAGPRSRTHFERKPPYARPEPKREKGLSEEMILADAWRTYQLRWATLNQSVTFTTPLIYTSIPWPVASEPFYPSTLTPERMAGFILSTVHSPAKSGMDRLRDAMKLWHPDKFEGRFMNAVAPSDRAVVREGLGMVARGLIELMRIQKKLGG